MNKLYLSVNNLPAHTDIFLDGKFYKPKKVKKKAPVIEYETNNSTVELTLRQYSHLNSRLWLLQEIMFFIISIFGIFDKRFGKFYYKENCKIVFNVAAQTNATIKFYSPVSKRPVLKCSSTESFNEVENVFELDKALKQKNKTLNIVKALIVVAVIITAILLIIL